MWLIFGWKKIVIDNVTIQWNGREMFLFPLFLFFSLLFFRCDDLLMWLSHHETKYMIINSKKQIVYCVGRYKPFYKSTHAFYLFNFYSHTQQNPLHRLRVRPQQQTHTNMWPFHSLSFFTVRKTNYAKFFAILKRAKIGNVTYFGRFVLWCSRFCKVCKKFAYA